MRREIALSILEELKKYPSGIWQAQLARNLKMSRELLRYYLLKPEIAKLIQTTKEYIGDGKKQCVLKILKAKQ